MAGLRTSSDVTGVDLGIPSLTARAWYEARYGREAFERIGRIPREDWRDYLDWFRDVLELPVENETEVTSIEPADGLLLAHLRRRGRVQRVHARKIVLATGLEGSGRWRAPADLVAKLPPERYAHSVDDIDFSRLAGKRVGVLGIGASALDNAAAALEAGAARVDLCFRRVKIPRVNLLTWMNFAGMLGHFGDLSDLERWRYMRRIEEDIPLPPPQEAFWRCRKFENFAWHANSAWHSIRDDGDVATVKTEAGSFKFDFMIFATGFETDLSARPELGPIVDKIALWRDRFTPPPGEENEVIARHPYLGPSFEFMERKPGTAPYLGRLHNFTLGALPSLGITGAAITGIKYGVPRMVSGMVRDLFREDAAAHYQDFLAYAEPELESLESEFTWIDRVGADALSDVQKLINELAGTPKRSRRARTVAPSRTKRSSPRSVKRRRDAN
jgi:cation diffusion facilitator CzcD-associated flavoprotein CzcO